jgi:hypothetical protein
MKRWEYARNKLDNGRCEFIRALRINSHLHRILAWIISCSCLSADGVSRSVVLKTMEMWCQPICGALAKNKFFVVVTVPLLAGNGLD